MVLLCGIQGIDTMLIWLILHLCIIYIDLNILYAKSLTQILHLVYMSNKTVVLHMDSAGSIYSAHDKPAAATPPLLKD